MIDRRSFLRRTLPVIAGVLGTAMLAFAEPGESLRTRLESSIDRLTKSERPDLHGLGVLLSTRYRYLLDAPPASEAERDAALEALLRDCRTEAAAGPGGLDRVAPEEVPLLLDGGDLATLAESLESGQAELVKLGEEPVPFGTTHVPASALLASNRLMTRLLKAHRDPERLAGAVREQFDCYRSPGLLDRGEILFTAYATSTRAGSRTRRKGFEVPLLGSPVKLGVSPGKFDRAAIYRGALRGRGLEVAWVPSLFDEYLIQTEGSAFLALPDGKHLHLTYAASNGRPHTSLSQELIKDGRVAPWAMDTFDFRGFFRNNPKLERTYLERNPRYIFFSARPAGRDPRPLRFVPGRTVASDRDYYPRGAVGFADTSAPVHDRAGKLAGSRPWRRFVTFDDTGSAIRGPGRIDLYQGLGPDATRLAHATREPGRLYLLLPRNTPVEAREKLAASPAASE